MQASDVADIGGGLSLLGGAGLGVNALASRLHSALGAPEVNFNNKGVQNAFDEMGELARAKFDPGTFFDKYTRAGSKLAKMPITYVDRAGIPVSGTAGDYILDMKSRMGHSPKLDALLDELKFLAPGKVKTIQDKLSHLRSSDSMLDSLAHYRGFEKGQHSAAKKLLQELHEGVYGGRGREGLPLTSKGGQHNLLDILASNLAEPKFNRNAFAAGLRDGSSISGLSMGGSAASTKMDDLLARIDSKVGLRDVMDDKFLTAADKKPIILDRLKKFYNIDTANDARTMSQYMDDALLRAKAHQLKILPTVETQLSIFNDPANVSKLPKGVYKHLRRAAAKDLMAAGQQVTPNVLNEAIRNKLFTHLESEIARDVKKGRLGKLLVQDDLLNYATRLSGNTMTQAPKFYDAMGKGVKALQTLKSPVFRRGALGLLGTGLATMGGAALSGDENVRDSLRNTGSLFTTAAGTGAGMYAGSNLAGKIIGKNALKHSGNMLKALGRGNKKLRMLSVGLNRLAKRPVFAELLGKGIGGAAGALGGGLIGSKVGDTLGDKFTDAANALRGLF